MNPEHLAVAVARTMTPFTPFLYRLAQTGGDKLPSPVENEPGWQKAQAVWQGVQTYFPNDAGIQGATMLLSENPDNQTVQNLLVQNLSRRIQESPQLAEALIKALGGQETVQQIVATDNGIIKDVEQTATGAGRQSIEASGGGRIEGAKQTIR